MKKILLLLSLIQLSYSSYAQVNFEKGFFLDNQNNKISGFIKNMGWLNNPTEIEYKLTKDSEVQVVTIDNLASFVVSNLKYQRFIVLIDRSIQREINLSYSKTPDFKEETLLLQEKVKGDYNLYSYVDEDFETFFFDGIEKNITQLFHKKYFKKDNIIAENNMYKQQLLNSLKCHSISQIQIERLSYSEKNISDFFKMYNTCKGISYSVDEKKDRKSSFGMRLKGGLTINSFKIPSRGITNPSPYEFDFGTIIGYQFGTEVEFVLGFNQNKWAVIIEPTYNSFKSETTSLNYNPEDVSLTYTTLELSIGLRHYFFINDISNFYINASLVRIFDLDSEFKTNRPGFDFEDGFNLSFGIGYSYSKYSIEFRYDTDRGQFFTYSNNFHPEFNSFSVILGMKIF